MSVKPTDKERLEHIIEAIDRIIRFTDGHSYPSFAKDEILQFAIIKNFEIIGEAAYHVSREIKTENAQIEWRKIIAFRHILVHDYYKINTLIVWNAIENKLKLLKQDIEVLASQQA